MDCGLREGGVAEAEEAVAGEPVCSAVAGFLDFEGGSGADRDREPVIARELDV